METFISSVGITVIEEVMSEENLDLYPICRAINDVKPKTRLGMLLTSIVLIVMSISCCGIPVTVEHQVNVDDPTSPVQGLRECMKRTSPLKGPKDCQETWHPVIEKSKLDQERSQPITD